MKQTIYYVDALAGAGKTYSTITQMFRNCTHGFKSVMVQPSMTLLKQTEDDILKRKPLANVTRIDTSTHEGEVVGSIVKYLKEAEEGSILLITHAAFLLIPYWDRPHEWHVYWDEVLSTVNDETLDLNESINKVIPLFQIFNFNTSTKIAGNYYDVSGQTTQLHDIALNRHDDSLYKILQSFATKAASSHYDLCVNSDDIDSIMAWTHEGKVRGISILKGTLFDDFAEATVLSALFTESLMFTVLEVDHDMIPHAKIIKGLQYTKHTQPVKFLYAFDTDRVWSKTFYNKKEDGKRIIDWFVDGINNQFDDKEFVYLQNLREDLSFNAKGEQLPYSAHGLNKWDHIHNFAGTGAYQSSSHFTNMAKHLGMDDIVKNERMEHLYYQTLMRTSIRNPLDMNPKTIIVPTKKIAENLSVHFEDVIIDRLPMHHLTIDGIRHFKIKSELQVELSDSIRYSRYNIEKQKPSITADVWGDIKTTRFVYNKYSNRVKKTDLLIPLTLIPSTAERKEKDRITLSFDTWDDLSHFLKKQTNNTSPSKMKHYLITPAIFGNEDFMGKTNITQVTNLWFDVDDNDMKPHLWMNYFPTDTRFIMYNSYSSSNDTCKYRVVIPTTQQFTVEEYELLVKYFMNQFKKDGYTGPDEKCKDASHIYFGPRKSKNQKQTFFVDKGNIVWDPNELLTQLKSQKIIDDALSKAREDERMKEYTRRDAEYKKKAEKNGLKYVEHYSLRIYLDELLDTMVDGNRSYTAQRLAGHLYKANCSYVMKMEYFTKCKLKGCEDSALKQFKKYAGL